MMLLSLRIDKLVITYGIRVYKQMTQIYEKGLLAFAKKFYRTNNDILELLEHGGLNNTRKHNKAKKHKTGLM